MKLLCLCVIASAIILQKIDQIDAAIPRIVIYVDPGADDAFALLVLLHAEKRGRVKTEAIVCTTGNSDLGNTCKNVVRLLEVFKRTDIPVYKGASKPIVPLPEDLPGLYFYGRDGFGDLKHDKDPDLSIIKDVPAAIAIYNLVSNNPKEIIIVCLGPLTTTALTMLLFEDFGSKLKQIWVMGGNYIAQGNITEQAEYNFYIDPESANIVLNGGCPVMLLTWETCTAMGATMDWRFNVLGKKRSPFMDLLNKVENKIYSNSSMSSNLYQCDAYATIAVIHPEIILRNNSKKARVELHNERTRGRLVFDASEKKENVVIIEKIDSDAVKKALLEAASDL